MPEVGRLIDRTYMYLGRVGVIRSKYETTNDPPGSVTVFYETRNACSEVADALDPQFREMAQQRLDNA